MQKQGGKSESLKEYESVKKTGLSGVHEELGHPLQTKSGKSKRFQKYDLSNKIVLPGVHQEWEVQPNSDGTLEPSQKSIECIGKNDPPKDSGFVDFCKIIEGKTGNLSLHRIYYEIANQNIDHAVDIYLNDDTVHVKAANASSKLPEELLNVLGRIPSLQD